MAIRFFPGCETEYRRPDNLAIDAWDLATNTASAFLRPPQALVLLEPIWGVPVPNRLLESALVSGWCRHCALICPDSGIAARQESRD